MQPSVRSAVQACRRRRYPRVRFRARATSFALSSCRRSGTRRIRRSRSANAVDRELLLRYRPNQHVDGCRSNVHRGTSNGAEKREEHEEAQRAGEGHPRWQCCERGRLGVPAHRLAQKEANAVSRSWGVYRLDPADEAQRCAQRARCGCRRKLEERVRAKLYATHRATDTNNPTLQAVANLIARSVPEQNLAGVVNFNFDNLLEQELTRRKISHSSIVSAVEIKRTGLTILHPHGFLPQTDKIDGCNLVFTEDEYHDLIESSFQWALTEIVHSLRHSTALFIGLSMSDPSLRRLLDASRESHDYPVHFQLLKRHVIQDSEEYQVLADVESRAQKIGKWLGMGEEKSPRSSGK